jgi:hypothetical protein
LTRGNTDDAKSRRRVLCRVAAISLKFRKGERELKIHHDPEKRLIRSGPSRRWWTLFALLLAVAGLVLFPAVVVDVLADRPENEGRFDGDGGGTPLNSPENGKNRDLPAQAFPSFPAPGSRAAVTATAAADGLSVAHIELPDGRQQTTVIDVRTRTMAVYHINPQTGVIALKSVRNLGWDLQIDDYNSGKPQPREIRALVERR